MLFIPGKLISLLTFPGIIIHELGHLAMCRLAKVKVHGWCLIRWDDPMGFVIHEKPESIFKSFLVTFGPFFANTLLTIFAVLFGTLFSYIHPLFGFLFLWIAISIGMHAFPSFQDAKNLLDHTMENIQKGKILHVLYLPFVGLIYIGGALSFFWADFIYAAVIIGGTISLLGLPLFYNTSEAPTVRVMSEGALVVGCDLSLDGQPLGETTENLKGLAIPKSQIESQESHTFKCDFVGCRDWEMNKNQIMSSGTSITLDWDNATFVDCETNEPLDENEIEIYKNLERVFTETTGVVK